ncbi:cell division protein FtsL [Elongatibacter sediminis]|uniref:Cell division protein FtsL n=1 Tax=Elongatibacter sediminis TaxID=3119006 RepID=A0AAW9RKY9_9GAMM
MNARLLIVLIVLVAVIGSALGVVYARHDSRRQAVRLGELENERDALIAEWSRLQLEQAFLADAGQVESRARDDLRMQSPESVNILVVRP